MPSIADIFDKKKRIVDFLMDKQARSDMGQGLTDSVNRGAIAGLLGGPVDAVSGVVNAGLMGLGYAGNKLGLLGADRMPQPIQKPVGGSEWIGDLLQRGKMVSENRNAPAELLAGLLAPSAVKGASRAAFAAEQNAMAPTPYNTAMRGQAGAVGKLDYRGEHTAPMKDSGAPLHKLNSNGVYPDDVYGPNGARYYGSGDAADNQAFALANYVKDRPDRLVTMYRAVPYEPTNSEQIAKLEKQKAKFMARNIVPAEWGGSRNSLGDGEGFYDYVTKEIARLQSLPESPKKKMSINNGDWVTITRQYAKDHGESALGGNYKILSKQVPARKLFTNGDSIQEFGYDESGKVLGQLLPYLAAGGLLGGAAIKEKQK